MRSHLNKVAQGGVEAGLGYTHLSHLPGLTTTVGGAAGATTHRHPVAISLVTIAVLTLTLAVTPLWCG
jgi:hypothetical protein